MYFPMDHVFVLGNNPKAKVIKGIIDLSKNITKECILVSSIDKLNPDLLPQWGEGRNLVIDTEISTPSQAMSISQTLYCNYRFWGAIMILVNGTIENKLKSCSFVGINGELLYGSEIAKQFGHGILNINRGDFLSSMISLLSDLSSITATQFETLLSQSEVGKLREVYRQSLHEQKSKIGSAAIQPILQSLVQLPRDKWDFSLNHQKVDWARGEIKRLYELCQAVPQIETQEINCFLAQTYAGVPNV